VLRGVIPWNEHERYTHLSFMKCLIFCFSTILLHTIISAQDLSQGLILNDLAPHPMQALDKPAYLETVVDPSFGTTIRRITDAQAGETIRTMYSTIQAWNADETRMILYARPGGRHILLDGFTYEYIKDLDIRPRDLEQVFWHFENPEIIFYVDRSTLDLLEYNVEDETSSVIVNLATRSGCTEGVTSGNDVHAMSWDNNVIGFRCGNSSAWMYRISTDELIDVQVGAVGYVAPMPFPSGQRYFHKGKVYNSDGTLAATLNISGGGEHSNIGVDENGDDHYFAISFAEGPEGGCLGDIIAHNAMTGECTSIIGTDIGYNYPQSGTHISALSHKNTEGGWITASMVGYDQDGQDLLDQEIVIAKASPSGHEVYRVAHHRSDEDQYDYWGEPHPVMSPSGTRIVFNSDWSGTDDGYAVDAYVIELPAFDVSTALNDEISLEEDCINIYPNPFDDRIYLKGISGNYTVRILNAQGEVYQNIQNTSSYFIDTIDLPQGLYFLDVSNQENSRLCLRKIIKS